MHKQMVVGQWQRGRAGLLALVQQHRSRPYVLAQKAALLEDFRRCAFHLAHPTPAPEDAVRGRLVSWKPDGRIEIEYSAGDLADFAAPEALGDARPRRVAWHGMVFQGPYTIELHGRIYRATTYDLGAAREVRLGQVLHVDRSEAGHVELDLGFARSDHGTRPARAVLWQAGKPRTLAEAPSPLQVDGAYRVIVEVGKRRVRATLDRTVLLDVPRPAHTEPGVFGAFGVEGRAFEKVLVRGRIHPGWVEARVDDRTQELLFDFDREYRWRDVPEWLLEGAIPDHRSFNPAEAWPADAETRHYPVLRDLEWLFQQERHQEGVDYVEELGRDVLPRNTRDYVLARFYFELDEVDKAMQHCTRLCRADPAFVTGRQLQAELRIRRGQGQDAAIADYRKLIAAHPGARELYTDLAVLLIQAGRTADAQQLLHDAVLRTGNGRELMRMQRMLDMVVRGPAWDRTYESRSAHYLVRSNISVELCKEAAAILEDARRVFAHELGRAPPKGVEPHRVFLFKGQTGYKRFCEDILGERDSHTDGFYSFALRQLLIWNLPDREQMRRTIRHEGLHQFLDGLVHDAPAWFDEGLAEYFEAFDGRYVRRDHLALLAKEEPIDLDRFLVMQDKVFYRGGKRHYAWSWAVVHLLRHGPERYRELPDRLMRELGAGRSPKASVRRAFAGVDLAALRRDLQAHLAQLRR